MLEPTCVIPVPATAQELERAIEDYRNSDLKGFELFCSWQAIREASLEQTIPEPENDHVSDEQSY